jgi:hypothetical protein
MLRNPEGGDVPQVLLPQDLTQLLLRALGICVPATLAGISPTQSPACASAFLKPITTSAPGAKQEPVWISLAPKTAAISDTKMTALNGGMAKFEKRNYVIVAVLVSVCTRFLHTF